MHAVSDFLIRRRLRRGCDGDGCAVEAVQVIIKVCLFKQFAGKK